MEGEQLKNKVLKNNETIYYRDVNADSTKEEVILLVHGNYSANCWWDEVVQGLRPSGYRIIVPDLRGFGKSTYNTVCSRFADWAKDIIQLCQSLGQKKIIVNGWSFGGGVAMKIVQLIPQQVSKLILTCSGPQTGLPTENEKGQYPKTKEQIAKIPNVIYSRQIISQNNLQAVRQIFDFVLFQKTQNFPENRKKALVQCAFAQKCYLQVLESLANSDINIDKISTKTLTIHGAQDPLISKDIMKPTAEKLGEFQVWAKHGHLIPIEDTQRYLKKILEFIQN